ncbi:unnamed protein product [Sphagnum tenellum]
MRAMFAKTIDKIKIEHKPTKIRVQGKKYYQCINCKVTNITVTDFNKYPCYLPHVMATIKNAFENAANREKVEELMARRKEAALKKEETKVKEIAQTPPVVANQTPPKISTPQITAPDSEGSPDQRRS